MAKAKQSAPAEVEGTLDGDGASFGEAAEGESLIVDLSNVSDAGFEPVPKGMYECVVENLEYKISQRSGNPMWSWVFEVVEHENSEIVGRKFFFHTVFAGKGLPMTKRAIGRVAPHLLEKPFDPKKVADEGSLVGLRVRVRVDINTYEGEKRNNVKDIYAAADGGEGFLANE